MTQYAEDRMPLPLNLDGLTPQWIGEALSHRYPGVEVVAASVDGIIVGTASKARLTLEYRGSSQGLPPTMYAKGGFHGPEQMQLGGAGYAREVMFYRHYAPLLDGQELPKSYLGATSAESGQSIVFLEDLTQRQVTFGKATRPVTRDTAAATLEWLARLHGRFWNQAELSGLAAWPGLIKQVIEFFLSGTFWTDMTGRPLAAPVPEELRNPQRVHQAMTAMWNAFEHQSPATFIHGDAHLGNMYFLPDGKPGFLDWQCPMRGPWADDVTYFLIGSLSVEDRRRYERELIRHYLDCLGAHAQLSVPSFDQAWLAYRQQVMHGFMWVATPPQMQPDDIVAANTERFCAALRDLETLKALGI
jgi:hypothetical protein